MPKSFFAKQILLTATVFAAIFIGIHEVSFRLFKKERGNFLADNVSFYTYLVENASGDKVEFVKELNSRGRAPFVLDLTKENISVLTGKEYMPDPSEKTSITSPLNDSSGYSLVISMRSPGPGGPKPGRGPGPSFLLFGALAFSVLLSSAVSLFVLFLTFRKKAEFAKGILKRMQKGDLKARFPTTFWDDTSQVLVLFNEMADEIETLVERLRRNEKVRTHLLQDLAHDLRTPVASLRTLIEGLQSVKPDEMTDLAAQEVQYLAKLVEDLLFLALVMEPKYNNEGEDLSLKDLVETQLNTVAKSYPHLNAKFSSDVSSEGSLVKGNPHQIRRMFRNALENAFSYAQSQVKVDIQLHDGRLSVSVADDGPGFDAHSLENYGKKRPTRYQTQDGENRISVGLGTVIMQTVADAHGLTMEARNVEPHGARVEIAFPKDKLA